MSEATARALAFVGSRLILLEDDGGVRLPGVDELAAAMGAERVEAARVAVVVRTAADLRGGGVVTFGFDEESALPPGYRADGLRVAYHALSEAEFRAAGTARQKLEWYRTHRFCSRCATPTVRPAANLRPGSGASGSAPVGDGDDVVVCPACGMSFFPRVAPAVIVLVQRGGEALLGRSHRFAPGVYSTLAGFVEAGESLEECVHREIAEEVGVRVDNLRYFGSQPHPFPHSLMVGFVADWASGEIRIDPAEIEDARWFTPDSLPELPHPMSIARALIEDFVDRVRRG